MSDSLAASTLCCPTGLAADPAVRGAQVGLSILLLQLWWNTEGLVVGHLCRRALSGLYPAKFEHASLQGGCWEAGKVQGSLPNPGSDAKVGRLLQASQACLLRSSAAMLASKVPVQNCKVCLKKWHA